MWILCTVAESSVRIADADVALHMHACTDVHKDAQTQAQHRHAHRMMARIPAHSAWRFAARRHSRGCCRPLERPAACEVRACVACVVCVSCLLDTSCRVHARMCVPQCSCACVQASRRARVHTLDVGQGPKTHHWQTWAHHPCTRTHALAHTCVRACMHMHAYAWAHTDSCTRTRIHARTHQRTQAHLRHMFAMAMLRHMFCHGHAATHVCHGHAAKHVLPWPCCDTCLP